jgi:hypothetical protein
MSETNKAVVRRLVDEVMNAGNMDLIDDIYRPAGTQRPPLDRAVPRILPRRPHDDR